MSDAHDTSAQAWRSPLTRVEAALASIAFLRPRFLFGLRLAASVCLALYITYYLELQNSFWAATTAAIVCQPNLGASLQKGRYRAIGTIVGALVMVALLALFPQQRNTLLFCLALWCGICGVAVVMLRNFASYAAALSGITAAIIFADTLADPSTAFFLAVIRVGEICIGIASAGLLIVLTDFGSASRQLAQTLRQTADQVATGFIATLVQGGDTPALQAGRQNVVRSLGPLDVQIAAAIGESAYLRSRNSNLQLMIDALIRAMVAWRNVGNHLARHGDDGVLIRDRLVPLLQRIDLAQLDRAPEPLQRTCGEVVAQIRAIPSHDSTSRIAIDAARDVAIGLAAMVDSVILLRDRTSRRLPRPRSPLVVADPLPALLNGVRVFMAVLGTSVFWVVSAWPSGPFAIVFAAIATLVFGSFGDQARALAKDYAIGATAMSALGAALYFGVLPSLSSFPALIAVLALLFIPLGMMQAGTWHSVVFLAMSIASLPLLGVGNPITYNASDYFNLAFAVVTGTIVGTLFFVFMPIIPPPIRARRLLALSLRDFRRLARGAWRPDYTHWTTLLTRRTEALPPQTTPEQAGSVMALLALGQAVILLRKAVTSDPAAGLLSQGLDALAEGRLEAARDAFGALARAIEAGPTSTSDGDTSEPVHLRAAVAVILDAIELHAALLTARDDKSSLFLSSFS